MFDYPSISDLSSFFVESAGGGEEEVEEWVEDTETQAAGESRLGAWSEVRRVSAGRNRLTERM